MKKVYFDETNNKKIRRALEKGKSIDCGFVEFYEGRAVFHIDHERYQDRAGSLQLFEDVRRTEKIYRSKYTLIDFKAADRNVAAFAHHLIEVGDMWRVTGFDEESHQTRMAARRTFQRIKSTTFQHDRNQEFYDEVLERVNGFLRGRADGAEIAVHLQKEGYSANISEYDLEKNEVTAQLIQHHRSPKLKDVLLSLCKEMRVAGGVKSVNFHALSFTAQSIATAIESTPLTSQEAKTLQEGLFVVAKAVALNDLAVQQLAESRSFRKNTIWRSTFTLAKASLMEEKRLPQPVPSPAPAAPVSDKETKIGSVSYNTKRGALGKQPPLSFVYHLTP